MELIEEQLEKLGFTPSKWINGIRSWEKVKNLDNWIETEWSLSDPTLSPKANLRNGITTLVWRLDGHTHRIKYRGDQDGMIGKISELNGIIFRQEIRDSKLKELGI